MPKVTRLRYHCPHCPLSFSQSGTKHRHMRQQHSNNPQRFTCPKCNQTFTTKTSRNLHLETVCAEIKPCYKCVFCNASFTRQSNRQMHMRCVHGYICREQDINLFLHLQHLSEEENFIGEWVFVESRLIEEDQHNICSCCQSHIKSYFFIENKINGNRTFVGSTCIENIDPRVYAVTAYFNHILHRAIQAEYKGEDSQGLQRFTVKSNSTLVQRLHVVKHLNPQVTRNLKNECEVLVKYPETETLIVGQSYPLKLKAKYVRG